MNIKFEPTKEQLQTLLRVAGERDLGSAPEALAWVLDRRAALEAGADAALRALEAVMAANERGVNVPADWSDWHAWVINAGAIRSCAEALKMLDAIRRYAEALEEARGE